MAQVEIYFFGLLCFFHRDSVGSGNVDFVEIVKDDGHRPLIHSPETGSTPITDEVEFVGLPRGSVKTDRCFDDVTHLSAHVQKNGGPAAHIGAHTYRVLMPSGTLTVAYYFPTKGMFPGRRLANVPYLTALIADASSDVDVTIDGKSKNTLKQNSWILVGNLGHKHKDCGAGMSHFERFLPITDGSHIEWLCPSDTPVDDPNCEFSVPANHTAAVLDFLRTPPLVADQVDCSSSQWP